VLLHHEHRLIHARNKPLIVYTSPLLRTMQTAAAIAERLMERLNAAVEVRIVPGLAECAAAVRMETLENMHERFLTAVDGEKLCPRLQWSCDSQLDRFEDCVRRLVTRHHQQQHTAHPALDGNVETKTLSCTPVVIVTHREGIRDLTELAGQRIQRTPYCCSCLLELVANDIQQTPSWKLLYNSQ
jgi:broad specificity phosphatase PhoE